jgi:hypothetical protein
MTTQDSDNAILRQALRQTIDVLDATAPEDRNVSIHRNPST